MRLADVIVSYSLQINNRCLRYLAECEANGPVVGDNKGDPGEDELQSAAIAGAKPEPLQAEMHTVYAESLLARDSRRLSSMWQLIGLEDPGLKPHVQKLSDVSKKIAEVASAQRLAMRLASLAQDEDDAKAMLRMARQMPADELPGWGVLNELFAADSHFWRQPEYFSHLDDEQLVKRVARSYRKAYRLGRELRELNSNGRKYDWLSKRHHKLLFWTQACAHQMELLRRGLSEKNKAQLWYMDKLADTLRMRAGLADLLTRADEIGLGELGTGELRAAKLRQPDGRKKSGKLHNDAQQARLYVFEQIAKMDKRTLRLIDNCLLVKPKKFAALLDACVAGLVVDKIRLTAPGGNPDAGQQSA